jgi:hypothetical protein
VRQPSDCGIIKYLKYLAMNIQYYGRHKRTLAPEWGQLYVEPHFERIANGILATKLKGTNPKDIRWFHYNPFHCPYNPESIGNYREVLPVVKDGKIVDASWEDLHFMPPVN